MLVHKSATCVELHKVNSSCASHRAHLALEQKERHLCGAICAEAALAEARSRKSKVALLAMAMSWLPVGTSQLLCCFDLTTRCVSCPVLRVTLVHGSGCPGPASHRIPETTDLLPAFQPALSWPCPVCYAAFWSRVAAFAAGHFSLCSVRLQYPAPTIVEWRSKGLTQLRCRYAP